MGGVFSDQGAHGTVTNGKITSTTPGTRVPLSSTNIGIHSVIIHALAGNTSDVYIGNSSMTTSNGLHLAKGDAVTVIVSNLALLYLDVTTSGDAITFLAT